MPIYTDVIQSITLLDGEEVFTFESAVLGQVCAVNGVAATIDAEASPQCVRSQTLGYFWVHGACKVAEGLNRILLSNFHDDAWARGHLLCHLGELGQHALVDLEKLLRRGPVQVEHLHGTDLKALVKDSVDNLTSLAGLDRVRLNHSACAISEHCTGAALAREPHVHFSGLLLIV